MTDKQIMGGRGSAKPYTTLNTIEVMLDNKHLNDLLNQALKELEKTRETLTEIKFWARELLKRTGQVVPYEIKQILQKISECEGNDE